MPSKYLYHPSLYEFDKPQRSYWEATAGGSDLQGTSLQDTQHCDVAIIGGGYTGLSAALYLARDFGVDVRLLEAGHIGWGASGRNGGFCTIGGTKLSLRWQLAKYGADETRRYYQSQVDAINLVRDLGKAENIDFLAQGSSEFLVADSKAHFAALQRVADVQKSTLGLDVQVHSQSEFRDIAYSSPHQHGAIAIRPAFALHPLRYARGLALAARRHGAHWHPHSEVMAWHKNAGEHILVTENGELRAKRVILTGNGFMPEHLHKGIYSRPLPLQSAIVVTRPMSTQELENQGWHTENPMVNSANLYFYYRLLSDRRLMLGGRADHTGTPAGAEKAYSGLEQSVAKFWPHFGHIEFTHQWRGLVCFTRSLRPSIGRMPEDKSVYFGFGYHGNGVKTATWTGRELAHWIAGKNSGEKLSPDHLPAIVRGRAPRIPLAFMRRQYVRAGLAIWKLRDLVGL